MSSEQRTLTAFPTTPDPERAPENDAPRTRRWRPQSKQDCQGCGGRVSPQYHKVFSDNDGILHACVNCSTDGEMFNGAGANL